MKTRIIWTFVLGWCAIAALAFAESSFIARVGQSGEFLELEHKASGKVVKNYLPLYQAGGVRYFSAGIGLEERSAEYPPFSLKLVFTAGGKPYLAGVDVTIQPPKGGKAILIAGDQVEGPWLFIDLPSGVYDISAAQSGHIQKLKGIRVVAGKQKTMYLRWAEDTGAMMKVPNE